jgi:prefoldin subunit 5|tara:strand:+ start:140 stop:382 length:243 start_codon:yes stop_codon:yes gene_type:complete
LSEELLSQIRWLEDKIRSLQDHICEIEFENHQLKSSIGNAIKTLEKQNEETKQMIWGATGGTITDSKNFTPLSEKNKTGD